MDASFDTEAKHREPSQADPVQSQPDAGRRDSIVPKPGSMRPARGGIRIRRLRAAAELDAVTPLFAEAHRATWIGQVPLNLEKGHAYYSRVLDDPAHHIVLAADRIMDRTCSDDSVVQTVGLLHGVAGPHMASDAWIATTRVFFVTPEIRRGLRGGEAALRLLRGFKSWAARVGPDGQGAAAIEIHVTSADDAPRSDKLFRRLGLSPIGGSYGAMTGGGA